MDERKLVFVFLFLLIIPLISSAPPFQTNTGGTMGLTIAGVDFTAIKTATTRTAVANVYNLTNGLPVYTASCQFQVFKVSYTGALIFTNNTPTRINNTYYFGIPNYVYNISGEYTRIIQCNTTTEGGFYKSSFQATGTGQELTTPLSIMYVSLTGIFLLLFMLIIYFIIKVNEIQKKNKESDEDLLSLSKLKYIKSTLIFIDWLLIVVVLFLTSNLSYSFLSETLFADLLFKLFQICFGLTLPFVILWFAWIFVQIIQDKKMKTMLTKGMYPQKYRI